MFRWDIFFFSCHHGFGSWATLLAAGWDFSACPILVLTKLPIGLGIVAELLDCCSTTGNTVDNIRSKLVVDPFLPPLVQLGCNRLTATAVVGSNVQHSINSSLTLQCLLELHSTVDNKLHNLLLCTEQGFTHFTAAAVINTEEQHLHK